MIFGRGIIGSGAVETKLSLRELVNRLHKSIEYLNKYTSQHDGEADPIRRVDALTRIVHERFRLQILVKKFGKAYLDAVDRNIRGISPEFILRYPQYLPQLKSIQEQIEKNLKWVIEEESRERVKSDFLRHNARQVLGRVKPAFELVRKKIGQLIKQKQQQSIKQKQQAVKPQRKEGILDNMFRPKKPALAPVRV